MLANFTRLSLTSTCQEERLTSRAKLQNIEASNSSTQASLAINWGTPSKHVSASSCCHTLPIIDTNAHKGAIHNALLPLRGGH